MQLLAISSGTVWAMTELLYEDIAARLATLIEQGTFAPGARLPGLRKLSRQFSVSVGTVVSACALLEAQGDRKSTRLNSSHYS